METVFTHNPTRISLDDIGIPETNESDYLKRIKAENLDKPEIAILFDLSALFDWRGTQHEIERIAKLLKESGAFATGFNE